MSYSVTVYKNTGFNANNIPDSPTLLESCPKLTGLPTLEILQDSGLSEIFLSASLSQIEGADYVRVGSWYYIVDGMPKMTSPDVVRLGLIPDFVTSAGGAGSLNYTDGVTERVCVPTSDDTFGKYTEDDPLTAPSQTLDLATYLVSYGSSVTDQTFIESTVDLYAGATGTEAVTYEDQASGEVVAVPFMPTVGTSTSHKYGGAHGTATYTVNATTQEGAKRARGLGVESGIVAQYSVPSVFVDSNTTAPDPTTGFIPRMDGAEGEYQTSNLPWEQGSVKNRRALYGEYVKYGILTMGGNKGEFRAEDIYESGTTSPSVKFKADIKSDGCPYWRFKSFLGDTSDVGFWRNCLTGAPWEQVPLVYSQKSGNILDRQEFNASREVAKSQRGREITSDIYGGIMKVGSNAMQGAGIAGTVGAVTGAIKGAVETGFSMYDHYKNYHEQGMLNTLAYGQSQVVAPELTFPFNSDIMRDALYNTCIVYRYYYKTDDLARIDKLLTMYGYRFTKPLEKTDFTNRPKFNYVKTQGGVGSTSNTSGRLPKWWNDGISAQLSAGVRVWHILPTVSAYSDNT